MNMEKDVEPIEISDEKLAMVVAASSALDYLNKKPNAGIEEAMKHVIKNFKATGNARLAGIAAANHVLKFKEKNIKATEKQAMQNLANSTQDILDSMKDNLKEKSESEEIKIA